MNKVTESGELLAEVYQKEGEKDGNQQLIEELYTAFKTTKITHIHARQFKGNYSSAINELQGGTTAERLLELEHQVATAAEKVPSVRWSHSAEYQEFRDRIWSVNHPTEELPPCHDDDDDDDNTPLADDEDLLVAVAKPVLKCPISQTILKDPVTSLDCGHTFSKASIYQLAASRPSIPCPHFGCNRNIIISRLKPNQLLERRIIRASQPRIFD